MNDLKPCPFCGGEDLATSTTQNCTTKEEWYACSCHGCGAHVSFPIISQDFNKTWKAWNDRKEGDTAHE